MRNACPLFFVGQLVSADDLLAHSRVHFHTITGANAVVKQLLMKVLFYFIFDKF